MHANERAGGWTVGRTNQRPGQAGREAGRQAAELGCVLFGRGAVLAVVVMFGGSLYGAHGRALTKQGEGLQERACRRPQASEQASQPASQPTSELASQPASKQAGGQAGRQRASKQAGRQARRQDGRQADRRVFCSWSREAFPALHSSEYHLALSLFGLCRALTVVYIHSFIHPLVPSRPFVRTPFVHSFLRSTVLASSVQSSLVDVV